MPALSRTSIGPNDSVELRGPYLVYKNGTRFSMQGIAFPSAPPTKEDDSGYNADGWIAVLEQLATLTEINTIRVYRMDCAGTSPVDYSAFLNRAAELGMYVVVPLTAPQGHGVLDRDKPAPHCYNSSLYHFGTTCLDTYTQYPNVLAGVIGNEVMNSIHSWLAAPCLKAYARDLKRYMQTNTPRSLSLLYAAQHDSLTAQILAEDAMKVTLDYLTCGTEESSIDMFGINIESWCSSLQSFRYNEDGSTETGYYALWQKLHNSTIPLVFSEMGCSKSLFNRDNGLERFVRDWRQVPVVLNDMSDTFSGFCAYAYDGNPVFRMMNPKQSWNGHDILDPSPDFDNFRRELANFHRSQSNSAPTESYHPTTTTATTDTRASCAAAIEALREFYHVDILPLEKMPFILLNEKRRSALCVIRPLVLLFSVWSLLLRAFLYGAHAVGRTIRTSREFSKHLSRQTTSQSTRKTPTKRERIYIQPDISRQYIYS